MMHTANKNNLLKSYVQVGTRFARFVTITHGIQNRSVKMHT